MFIQKEFRNADINLINIDQELADTKLKAAEFLYVEADKLLNSGSKIAARQAYGRVQKVKELQSMVAISKDKKLFKFVAVDGYWSSEEDKKDEVNVMEAFSTNGHVFAADRCDTSHFRCVRDYR